MRGGRGRRRLALSGPGWRLVVDCSAESADSLRELAAYLPGVTAIAPAAGLADDEVAVRLPDAATPGDVRRVVNAHLHLLHLARRTLAVHAVAVRHPARDTAALLLGGHGAGKTLVMLALAKRGWQILTADVTLLDVPRPGGTAAGRGGTRALTVRRTPTHRWFPDLVPSPAGPASVDLTRVLRPFLAAPLARPVPVETAVLVDIDGDQRAADATCEPVDEHTAANLWWRASGHLLDRVLDSGSTALRELEDRVAVRNRASLVRVLAASVPMHAAWGTPGHIAARVEELTARVPARPAGERS